MEYIIKINPLENLILEDKIKNLKISIRNYSENKNLCIFLELEGFGESKYESKIYTSLSKVQEDYYKLITAIETKKYVLEISGYNDIKLKLNNKLEDDNIPILTEIVKI